jgi:hypothetical protein
MACAGVLPNARSCAEGIKGRRLSLVRPLSFGAMLVNVPFEQARHGPSRLLPPPPVLPRDRVGRGGVGLPGPGDGDGSRAVEKFLLAGLGLGQGGLEPPVHLLGDEAGPDEPCVGLPEHGELLVSGVEEVLQLRHLRGEAGIGAAIMDQLHHALLQLEILLFQLLGLGLG